MKFHTHQEAMAAVAELTDCPVAEYERVLSSGVTICTRSYAHADGEFTNSYDVSYPAAEAAASIDVHDSPRAITDVVCPADKAIVSGGFFVLADDGTLARQASLNFAASANGIHSMPVSDKEAVVISEGHIVPRHVRAMGELSLDGRSYRWRGSKTDHTGAMTIFSNGNLAIDHVPGQVTSTRRVVRESSKLTPLCERNYADVGFVKDGAREFRACGFARAGGLDITQYDFAVRMKEKQARRADVLTVDVVDDMVTTDIEGGFSAGPLLMECDFAAHPINSDEALGSYPSFTNRRMARLVLYITADETVHFRLFDARPGSQRFTGVTPREARRIIAQEVDGVAGVFLDGGQTAKMYVAGSGLPMTMGNRHYVQWPQGEDEKFVWTPDSGRPIPSMIRVQ